MKVDNDIAQRLSNFYTNLYQNSEAYHRGRSITDGLERKVSSAIGEEVLLHNSIRTVAYLLGYNDPKFDSEFDGPTGLTWDEYIKIEKRCKDGIINFSRFFNWASRRKRCVAIKRSVVESVFSELSREQKLLYTPERFDAALREIRLKR